MPRLLTARVLLYLLFLLVLDICMMPAWGGFRPVLTYLWILYVAFYGPLEAILPAAFLTGVLRDLVSSQPLGVETASLVSVAAGLIFLMQKLQHDFFPFRVIGAGVFVASALLLNLTLSSFLASSASYSTHAFLTCFSAAFSSAVFAPLFFHLTSRWFREGSRPLKQYELFS